MLEASIRKKLSSFTLDVSFETDCAATSILGVSGSGKSITLKCIAGIMKPDRGRIVLDGRVLYDSDKHIDVPPQERHIGYMFQNYALFPDMTVRQNILTGLRWQRDKAEKARAAEEISSMLRISHILDRKPGKISGGEAQRTALARMLVNRPSLLLFDEPFSALDVHLRSELQMELLDLLERIGKEYIIVTHSKDEAFRLSRSTYVLDDGNIIRHGIPADVFRNPGTVRAARLVGYHNISRASMKDGRLQLSEWGISIDAPDSYAVAIPDDGAYFSDDGIPADIVRVIDDEKARLLLLRFSGNGLFWLKVPEGAAIPADPRVSFRRDSLMMLSE